MHVVKEEVSITKVLGVPREGVSRHPELPTAYPSRRVWLHVTVRDSAGKAIFGSGAVAPSRMIQRNDNDIDAKRFEPQWIRQVRLPLAFWPR